MTLLNKILAISLSLMFLAGANIAFGSEDLKDKKISKENIFKENKEIREKFLELYNFVVEAKIMDKKEEVNRLLHEIKLLCISPYYTQEKLPLYGDATDLFRQKTYNCVLKESEEKKELYLLFCIERISNLSCDGWNKISVIANNRKLPFGEMTEIAKKNKTTEKVKDLVKEIQKHKKEYNKIYNELKELFEKN